MQRDSAGKEPSLTRAAAAALGSHFRLLHHSQGCRKGQCVTSFSHAGLWLANPRCRQLWTVSSLWYIRAAMCPQCGLPVPSLCLQALGLPQSIGLYGLLQQGSHPNIPIVSGKKGFKMFCFLQQKKKKKENKEGCVWMLKDDLWKQPSLLGSNAAPACL